MGVTHRLAEHVSQMPVGALPPEAREATRKDILDCLAVAIAGSGQAGVDATVRLVERWGGRPEATVYLHGLRAPVPHAALANTVMGHALDFDDTHDGAVLHAGIGVVHGALGVAEAEGRISGEEYLAAVGVAVDLVCRLGLATGRGPTESGWHLTALYSYLGAAAAAARLLHLDVERTRDALALASCQAAGNLQYLPDAALSKRFQPAFGAMGGVIAAYLARDGVTGPARALEGEYGLFPVYHGQAFNLDVLTADLGQHWEVANLGFKPYPCCRYNHAAIDAALDLHRRLGELSAARVEKVEAGLTAAGYRAVGDPPALRQEPHNAIDAEFSAPWCVSVALSRGSIGLADFAAPALAQPDLRALARLVVPYVDADLERAASRECSGARVRMRLADGSRHEAVVLAPLGSKDNPLSYADVATKFRAIAGQARTAFPPERVEALIAHVGQIERLADVASLARLLS